MPSTLKTVPITTTSQQYIIFDNESQGTSHDSEAPREVSSLGVARSNGKETCCSQKIGRK